MRLRSTSIAALVTVLSVTSPAANACSCNLKPLGDVYKRSHQVFVAKVDSVSLITEKPAHDKMATYSVTFEVLRAFKGNPADIVRLKFKRLYQDPSINDLIIGGCDPDFAQGEEYLILKRRWRNPRMDWCSSEVHALHRVDLPWLESFATENR